MRVRHAKPLPARFKRHPKARKLGILAEYDIRVSHASRLRAKLLVFPSRFSMRRFWRDVLGRGDLGRAALGAVTALSAEVTSFPSEAARKRGARERSWIECDPRYFCIIALSARNLSMDVISHEAVHAGFAYAGRVPRGSWWASAARENPEESVCYPAGIIAAGINGALHDGGFYKAVLAPARKK